MLRTKLPCLGVLILLCSCGDESTTQTEVDASSSSTTAISSSAGSSSEQLSSEALPSSSSLGLSYGVLQEGDKTYRTITIGQQEWMADNLDKGAMVLGASADSNQQNDSLLEKFCYADDSTNCEAYGGLYQWAEAMKLPYACNYYDSGTTQCPTGLSVPHQGICPDQWHIPTAEEWDTLAVTLGGDLDSYVAGAYMKSNQSGFAWDMADFNYGVDPGFSALPSGYRNPSGEFKSLGEMADYWEADAGVHYDTGPGMSHYRGLSNGSSWLYRISLLQQTSGFAVRCVKNTSN